MAQGKQFPVQIVIGAVDEITMKVMAINEKIKKITEPRSKIGGAFKTLSDELGLGKVGSAISDVGSHAKDFAKDLGESLAVLAAFGYASFRLIKDTADWADQIGEASERLGISTKAFQVW